MRGLGKGNTLPHSGLTYKIWAAMMARCYKPHHHAWQRYGGRGITVDIPWHQYETFYTDMGEKPAGLTLERVKNGQSYSKANCIWATRTQQQRNTRHVKLTVENVADIRRRFIKGTPYHPGNAVDLAKEYCIGTNYVHSLARGEGWS